MSVPAATVAVDLERRAYEIEIGEGLLTQAATLLQQHVPLPHAFVISDENVGPLYAEPLKQQLHDAGLTATLLTIAPGEASKSITMAERLWNDVLSAGADRKSVIIAVGGGVVGDLAGFVAASFARGIPFVQIPTSLLAQVDSSVGGKVGVNLPGAKNMVGAFWQPRLVLADTAVLNTLPAREFKAGLAEVAKYGVIYDAPFFEFLEANIDAINSRDLGVMQEIIKRCCQIKAAVVIEDERETSGHRAILNYGHTYGHALEALTKYQHFVHGEAVSIGMMCAAHLAAELEWIDHELVDRQRNLLSAFGLPTGFPDLPTIDTPAMLTAMQSDKKVDNGVIRLILPTELGKVTLTSDVSPEQIAKSLDSFAAQAR